MLRARTVAVENGLHNGVDSGLHVVQHHPHREQRKSCASNWFRGKLELSTMLFADDAGVSRSKAFTTEIGRGAVRGCAAFGLPVVETHALTTHVRPPNALANKFVVEVVNQKHNHADTIRVRPSR